MSNEQLERSRAGLARRAAVALVGLAYGCCATLLIPSTLSGFAEYEYALSDAYDMARTATIVALVAGCVAAVAAMRTDVGLPLLLVAVTLMASVASIAGAAMTNMPMAATVVLPTVFFVLAGPILIVLGARWMVASGLAKLVAAGLIMLIAILAGASAAFALISDDISVVRIRPASVRLR